MRCIEARSIREIDEADWDSVAGNIPSMTHRWLRVAEACWRFYAPRYLLLTDERGPCVAVMLNTSVAFQKNLGLVGWLYQRLSLVARSPFSSMCSIVTRPGVSPASIMPELQAALNRLRREEKRLFIAVGNVGAAELPLWEQTGFLASAQTGVSVIDLPSTYDLYLEALNPKDRSELRRAHRRAAQFNLHAEMGHLANDNEQIYSLLCEVYALHGDDMPFTPRLLPALEQEMPGETLFLRTYAGETLAGAFLSFLNGSTLWGLMAGLHYEISRPSYLYFFALDESIRWSIAHGVQKIFMGRTNEREKQRHGFHLEERWLCYRAGSPLLNQGLTLSAPLVKRLTHSLAGQPVSE